MKKDNFEEQKEAVINMLKDQRYQIDDTLQQLTGNRFDESLFDAKTVNDMIQTRFGEIAFKLDVGDVDTALEWSKEGAAKEWIKFE